MEKMMATLVVGERYSLFKSLLTVWIHMLLRAVQFIQEFTDCMDTLVVAELYSLFKSLLTVKASGD